MIVFHGTGHYVLPLVLKKGLAKYQYPHVPVPCACTSTDFNAASRFAIRKTSADDFRAGLISGVVLEFNLAGVEGKDYTPAKGSSLQEEYEIAVLNIKRLTLVAVWKYDSKWVRHPLEG